MTQEREEPECGDCSEEFDDEFCECTDEWTEEEEVENHCACCGKLIN